MGRSGKKKRDSKSSKPRGAEPDTIDAYLNNLVEKKAKHRKRQIEFIDAVQRQIEAQWEQRAEKISAALHSASTTSWSAKLGRIVDAKYATDPLCTVGSTSAKGGRFNIGLGLNPTIQAFPALYLADTFGTSYAECFHYEYEDENAAILNLHDKGGFSFVVADVKLHRVLDIRKDSALSKYATAIQEVGANFATKTEAKKLGIRNLNVPRKKSEIYRALHTPNFLSLPTWIKRPSMSQWFGYQTKSAGIEGIIYNSVRNSAGWNLVVFPEALKLSSSIELVGQNPAVPMERQKLNSENRSIMHIPYSQRPKLQH